MLGQVDASNCLSRSLVCISMSSLSKPFRLCLSNSFSKVESTNFQAQSSRSLVWVCLASFKQDTDQTIWAETCHFIHYVNGRKSRSLVLVCLPSVEHNSDRLGRIVLFLFTIYSLCQGSAVKVTHVGLSTYFVRRIQTKPY